jgi:hypothetical protein
MTPCSIVSDILDPLYPAEQNRPDLVRIVREHAPAAGLLQNPGSTWARIKLDLLGADAKLLCTPEPWSHELRHEPERHLELPSSCLDHPGLNTHTTIRW